MKRKRDSIEEEVLDRVVGASEDPSTANEELRELLARSPEHVREYLHLEALWRSLADPELAGPIQRAAAGRRPRRWFAIAALVIVALGVAIMRNAQRGQVYFTSAGEIDTVQLSDRSVIFLNSDSRVETAYTESERRVILSHGEALFEVAKTPDRPFVVESGATRIIVAGTEFAVRREGESVTVTVLAGEVIVESEYGAAQTPRLPEARETASREPATAPGGARPVRRHYLGPGKKMKLHRDSSPVTVEDSDPEPAGWRPRRLVVDSRPLAEVVADFNRLNVEKIEIEGDLRDLRISGVFDVTDPDPLLDFLGSLDGIVIEHRSDAVIRCSRGHSLVP